MNKNMGSNGSSTTTAKAPVKRMTREEMLAEAKKGVKKQFGRHDLSIMQGIRAIDDLDEIKSMLSMRVEEWFKLNFPEIDLTNEESLCAIVAEFGDRESFEYTQLAELVGDVKATEILEKAEKSFGADLDPRDRQALMILAREAKNVFDSRKKLEKHVEDASKEAFPNLCYLIEPLLAARLVTQSGGLEKMAKMSASTIQVMGAEKALFKHLRKGTKPPKHGLIFQSPLVRGSAEGRRGAIARALAAKLAICAKADFYTHNFIADKLKADLEKRIKEI